MRTTLQATLSILVLMCIFACDAMGQTALPLTGEVLRPLKNQTDAELLEKYKWLGSTYDIPSELATLDRAFPAPSGYWRVEVKTGSYAGFLRRLPLRTDRTNVLSYKGSRLGSPSAAIVAIDVGDRNLQQCADSAIRLHAEYLWSIGQGDAASYHFTSGDISTWKDWRRGERFKVSGSKVQRVLGRRVANDHVHFRDYLEHLFRYAGTRSLARDSQKVQINDVQGGDFFVTPGSPGHAVVVLDVVENAKGDRLALIGQGFMPAQDFHVVKTSNRRYALDGVWFKLPAADGKIHTPSWAAFQSSELRRFD